MKPSLRLLAGPSIQLEAALVPSYQSSLEVPLVALECSLDQVGRPEVVVISHLFDRHDAREEKAISSYSIFTVQAEPPLGHGVLPKLKLPAQKFEQSIHFTMGRVV